MPLRYHLNESTLLKLLGTVNGLLIPGGGTDLFNKNNKEYN